MMFVNFGLFIFLTTAFSANTSAGATNSLEGSIQKKEKTYLSYEGLDEELGEDTVDLLLDKGLSLEEISNFAATSSQTVTRCDCRCRVDGGYIQGDSERHQDLSTVDGGCDGRNGGECTLTDGRDGHYEDCRSYQRKRRIWWQPWTWFN